MIIITTIILLLYSFIIILFIIGFEKIEVFKHHIKTPQTKFSIIIPFRNEEKNLPELLKSLEQLNYPKDKFEIIFVDDDSTDNSVQIITEFKNKTIVIKNNRVSNSPKKDAIKTAIKKAQFDWIITTDADCVVPQQWLNAFDTFIQIRPSKLIAAPVKYTANHTFLEQFQVFDFLSLQVVTVGGYGIRKPFLCNGANLCYHKPTFFEVNGFEGNEHIASGDDIFLLEKITKKYPNEVHFLKSTNALVSTKPQTTFKDLLSQRIRWATKTSFYSNHFPKFVGIIVILMNFLIIDLTIQSIFDKQLRFLVFLSLIIKLILDGVLIKKQYSFLKEKFNFLNFILSSLCYPFFSMFVVLSSLKRNYHWKGRQFKK